MFWQVVMGKYEPLGEFLRKQRADEVRLTFAEIERLTGDKLPPSARYRAWWSNNPTNSVMTKVWLAAGFKTARVDMGRGKLVFQRARKVGAASQRGDAAPLRAGPRRHPLFGALKGLMQIMPGTDLTKPADPDWGKAK
jgi:hypothetical protein